MIDSPVRIPLSEIEATPNPALVDQIVRIRLAGFAPDQLVTLQATLQDDTDQLWASYATFMTDAHGAVDVAAQQPLAGTYEGIDATGLFWSMLPQNQGQEPAPFTKRTLTSLAMHFTATVEDEVVAATTLERLFVAPVVTITPVREQGLVATLFRPAGDGPFPGVIVLGGSEGGIVSVESRAALFAADGYAALALAYFAIEPLPATLTNLPLEYFETALQWFRSQSSLCTDKLALVGGSRGAELVLLLASMFPQVNAVVAVAPSNVLWSGVSADEEERRAPAWTYGGQPLPSMPPDARDVRAQVLDQPVITLTPLFLHGLADPVAVAQASIPVEQIRGPVLLISGQDDQMWPGSHMAELVTQRLAQHNFPYPYQHLSYPGAGHLMRVPYLPTTVAQGRHPVTGWVYAFGGNAKASAVAWADSWARILNFLAESLHS